MKCQTPYDQNEQLPNLLGLRAAEEIGLAEFEGFLKAEIVLSGQLTNRTSFTCRYIQKIHRQALGHLYGFAGKWRDVNLSKGGFVFAAAHFLPNTRQSFEADILKILPNQYSDIEHLIHDLAVVHAELLFIHPFREGKGRTARLLANLMCRKQGLNALQWGKIEPNEGAEISFTNCIHAVQQASSHHYEPMKRIIGSILPA